MRLILLRLMKCTLPVAAIGSAGGFHALRPPAEWQEQMARLQSLARKTIHYKTLLSTSK